jgi:hypothetical protein
VGDGGRPRGAGGRRADPGVTHRSRAVLGLTRPGDGTVVTGRGRPKPLP